MTPPTILTVLAVLAVEVTGVSVDDAAGGVVDGVAVVIPLTAIVVDGLDVEAEVDGAVEEGFEEVGLVFGLLL